MFRRMISPIFRSTRLSVTASWYNATITMPAGSLDVVPLHPGYRPATSWLHYATSYKHSLVLLRMGEIIARNMLSWLELLINRYCCIWLVVYIITIQTLGHSACFCSQTKASFHFRSSLLVCSETKSTPSRNRVLLWLQPSDVACTH